MNTVGIIFSLVMLFGLLGVISPMPRLGLKNRKVSLLIAVLGIVVSGFAYDLSSLEKGTLKDWQQASEKDKLEAVTHIAIELLGDEGVFDMDMAEEVAPFLRRGVNRVVSSNAADVDLKEIELYYVAALLFWELFEVVPDRNTVPQGYDQLVID